jgi:chitodextrinase
MSYLHSSGVQTFVIRVRFILTLAAAVLITGVFLVADRAEAASGFGTFYGSVAGTNLANKDFSDASIWQSLRFRAQYSGPLADFRTYITENTPAGGGYCAGTGGPLSITLQSDSDGNPSGIILAGPFSVNTPCGQPSSAAFPLVAVPGTPSLTAGAVYHLVFKNGNASPTTNWNSLDYLCNGNNCAGTADVPNQPMYPNSDWAMLRSPDGGSTWVEWDAPTTPDGIGYTPILELHIGSNYQGQGYMETSHGNPYCVGAVGGMCLGSGSTNQIRETFTPTTTKTVSAVSIRLQRNSGAGNITATLRQGSTVIESGTIPATSFPIDGKWHWGAYTFTTTRTLTPGTAYTITFGTDNATSYTTMGVRDGATAGYGFSAASTFSDGWAQFSTDGSTWSNWTTGGSPATDQDLQFYFDLGSVADTIAPSVPTNLSGTAISSSQINLTWTASTDNVGVTGYKIFRNGAQVGTSATASYSDTGLTANTTYSYTVSAYDAAGNNSAPSAAKSVSTVICYTGTNVWQSQPITAQTGNFEIQFDMTPNVSNLPNGVIGLSQNAATAYTDLANIIAFETRGVIDARNGGTYQAQTVMNYTGGNKYHARMDVYIPTHTYSIYVTPPGSSEQTIGTNYAVRTEQAADTSINYLSLDPSAGNVTVCGITTSAIVDTTPPSIPTNLSGTVISSSQINLTWTASTDNVAVTGYKVFRNGTQVGTSAAASYSDTGLAASTVYSYTVGAYDAAGNNSAQSASINTITLRASAPVIAVGSRVTTTANLNVRQTASPGATKLGTEPVGSLGTVVGGPTTASGHTWWQINYDNTINGWSIGDYLVAVPVASSPAIGMTTPFSPIASAQSMSTNTSLIYQLDLAARGTSSSVSSRWGRSME